MEPGRVVIVGAGIGGTAAAAALARAGWSVRLLEGAADFSEVGAGLSVSPNAAHVLRWLGLARPMLDRSRGQGFGVRTRRGRWLVRMSHDDLAARFGYPILAMHRADLHRMLLDAAADADVRASHRVDAVRPDPAGGAQVDVTTAEGTHTEHADLVVAADGVHSRLRSALYPGHPGATHAGYVTWRGIAPAGHWPELTADPIWTDSWGRGTRFGSALLADGRVFWYVSASGPRGAFAEDAEEQVAARVAGWHAPVDALLRAACGQGMLRGDVWYVGSPVPSFVAGPLVLLGDSAHAVTPDIGQGAGLAMEDAVELATALGAHRDVAAALAAYDARRRPRTQKLAALSGRSAALGISTSRPVTALRDLALAAIPSRAYMEAGADALGWRPPAPAPAAVP